MTLSHWRLPGIVGSALSALLIGLLAIAVFGPLLNMLIWTVTEAWYFPAKLPVRWGFAFWDKVFRPEAGAMRALGTSLLIAGLTVALSLAVAIPAGYALSRRNLPLRSLFRQASEGGAITDAHRVAPFCSPLSSDEQGRTLLSKEHIAQLGLKGKEGRELVFVGVYDRIEIWPKKTWDERESQRRLGEAAPILGEPARDEPGPG